MRVSIRLLRGFAAIAMSWCAAGAAPVDSAPGAKPPSGSPDNTVMFICGEQQRL